MEAKRLILETDAAGNLKQVPKLPPNQQVEAIFLLLSASDEIQDLSKIKNVTKPTVDEIMSIARQFSDLPELDSRDMDEILGYDQYGLPT